MKILLVEDDALIRAALHRALRRNFDVTRVYSATSVIDAIDILRGDDPIDLVISDFNLVGVPTGGDLVEWVINHMPALGTRFMFFSSDELAHNYHMPVVTKPASTDSIIRAVKVFLEQPTS